MQSGRTGKFFILLLMGLLSACSSTTPLQQQLSLPTNLDPQAPTHTSTQDTLSPAQYLKQAQQASSSDERTQHTLAAANGLVTMASHYQAQSLLDRLKKEELSPEQQVQKHLIQAKLDLLLRRTNHALSQLQPLQENDTLTVNQHHALHALLALAYRQNQHILQSTQTRIALYQQATDLEDRSLQARLLWEQLNEYRIPKANLMEPSETDQDLVAWLELAHINRRMQTHPLDPTNQALQDWQQRFPEHIAHNILRPSSELPDPAQPQRIALLLPLKGPLHRKSQAIRDGFIASYYHAKQHKPKQPRLDIHIYDTSEQSVGQSYTQAVIDGAQWVVGPLTKPNIAALIASDHITTPTLALNQISGNQSTPDNLFQFDLSPESEARQAAIHAYQIGYRSALVLQEDGDWGSRVSHAFQETWQNLGGTLQQAVTVKDPKNAASVLMDALHIKQGQNRAKALQKNLPRKLRFRFIPHHRRDIDMVFLALSSRIARQIVPMLKYYYAGDLATYATSAIYDGHPNPYRDHDLDGVYFCDSAWILGKAAVNQTTGRELSELQHQIKQSWPSKYTHDNRFYALGVDAFYLLQQLPRLQQLRGSYHFGANGRLYMNDQRLIQRELDWAVMRNGTPHRTPPRSALAHINPLS